MIGLASLLYLKHKPLVDAEAGSYWFRAPLHKLECPWNSSELLT